MNRHSISLKRIISIGLIIGCLFFTTELTKTQATGDVQVVQRTVSYAYPETGEPVDGGTNVALGNSMAQSIIDPEVLIETIGGETYVTIGINMMSNISSVKIKTQQNPSDSFESFKEAGLELVNSYQLKDTCHHYRFKVTSATNYISPVLFVKPMGREVQFFIKLNMASAKPGRGTFDHPQQNQVTQQETPKPNVSNSDGKPSIVQQNEANASNEKPEEANKDDQKDKKEKQKQKKQKKNKKASQSIKKQEKKEKKSKSSSSIVIGGVIITLAVIGGAYVFYNKKGLKNAKK